MLMVPFCPLLTPARLPADLHNALVESAALLYDVNTLSAETLESTVYVMLAVDGLVPE